MGAVIVGAKKGSHDPFFILPSASERVESKHINVLFVCEEWNSSKGGLAAFNRKFAINLMLKHQARTLRFTAMFAIAMNRTEKMLDKMV